MTKEALRELWINYSGQYMLCHMLDGKTAMLIIGPSDSAVQRGNWKFGFQVHGEEDIRWRDAEQIDKHFRDRLIERPAP